MRYAAVPLVVALLAGLSGLSGCADSEPGREPAPPTSSSSAPTASPTPSPTTSSPARDDGPVAAYSAWLDALQARDAAGACARHAPDFTIELRYEAVLLDRAELGDPCVGFVAVLWEQPDREYDPIDVEVTQETDEDALLAVDFAGVDQTVTMQRRNARWFVLDTGPRNQVGGEPQRWLAAWCDLELGMDVATLADLMGEPSGTYTIGNGGEPQLWWAQDQYDFRAYLDADPPSGVVLDLVGDYDRLSTADRALVPCPELR